MILTIAQKKAFKDVLGIDDASSHVDGYTLAYVNHITAKAVAEVGLKKHNRIKRECTLEDVDGMIAVLDERIIAALPTEPIDIKKV